MMTAHEYRVLFQHVLTQSCTHTTKDSNQFDELRRCMSELFAYPPQDHHQADVVMSLSWRSAR